MSDEKLKAAASEGQNAAEFINNRRYQKAKIEISAMLLRQFRKTKFKESAERDEIWRKMQALDWLENNLERAIRDGANAEKTLLQRVKEKVLRVA